ncbi:hypothetical protein OAO18_09015, partial [Francisellaceae bacterium]|nr:hypothetical protein [Francisellaceae bacterium]
FASKGNGIVIIPEYLELNYMQQYGLKKIKNASIKAKEIKFYYKADLSIAKMNTIRAVYKNICGGS